jgi:hypothetical protein
MSTLLHNRTPAQLAWIIAASNLFASSGFAVFFVDTYRHPHGHRFSPFAASISFALILGLVLGALAETALKDGIASEQWPESLLVTTRKIFMHPALSAATLLLLVASIAVVVFSSVVFSSAPHFGAAWIFLIPSMSLTRIRGIFSPPRESASGLGSIDSPKPIQSEHWGVPPQSFPR